MSTLFVLHRLELECFLTLLRQSSFPGLRQHAYIQETQAHTQPYGMRDLTPAQQACKGVIRMKCTPGGNEERVGSSPAPTVAPQLQLDACVQARQHTGAEQGRAAAEAAGVQESSRAEEARAGHRARSTEGQLHGPNRLLSAALAAARPLLRRPCRLLPLLLPLRHCLELLCQPVNVNLCFYHRGIRLQG